MKTETPLNCAICNKPLSAIWDCNLPNCAFIQGKPIPIYHEINVDVGELFGIKIKP